MPPIGPLMFLIPIKPSIFLLAQLDGQTNIHAEQSLQWFSIVLSLPGLLKYDKLWRSSSNRNYPREIRLEEFASTWIYFASFACESESIWFCQVLRESHWKLAVTVNFPLNLQNRSAASVLTHCWTVNCALWTVPCWTFQNLSAASVLTPCWTLLMQVQSCVLQKLERAA